jgi:hypothetical protein
VLTKGTLYIRNFERPCPLGESPTRGLGDAVRSPSSDVRFSRAFCFVTPETGAHKMALDLRNSVTSTLLHRN